KDKLFFFIDAERLKQDLIETVVSQGPFAGITGGFNSPFRGTNGVAKLGWHINTNYHMFYRFSYGQNNSIPRFIPNNFHPFNNLNHPPLHPLAPDLPNR